MHATTTKEHMKSAANHIEEGSRRIKRDASDTADRVHGDFSSIAHNVGEQVREYIETAGEGLAQAKDTLSEAGGSVAAQISENPLKAGVLLLGAGVLLGVLLRR